MTPKAKPAAKAAKKPAAAKKSKRIKWLSPKTDAPLIDRYARKMRSYLKASADGVIEKHELKEQEELLTGLMKEVEPALDDALHAKVTRLLCELTVYDIMQMMHTLQDLQPATKFRG